MNQELILILDSLEREKGISRQVLLEAMELALVSAAKKVIKVKESEVNVKINPKTGEISVFSEGHKIESKEFGRIAAQTAKQVIIQKLREAEKDVIYDEYHDKVFSIINGTVYRFDKGAVILDLGKSEAILPKREQSPRDHFRQGDRIRVFLLEVDKAARGPQLVVSRTHPGLVKKLFELEVPEVLESIVEIKSVAREPGDRSKIAVWSKDEKVDCVGACVGMRGSRVKNIVKELQGEKIDIVRWSENVIEFVQAALSPAQCASVKILDNDEKKVEVLVDEDQLSLAIGKNGQNVRLASRLTGWNIDIKSKKDVVSQLLDGQAEPVSSASAIEELASMPGIGEKTVGLLAGAGFKNLESVAHASAEDLTQVEGIGAKTADKLILAAQEILKKKDTESHAGEERKEADQETEQA